MTQTLLKMTQDILSDLNEDPVNSIADTLAADQIAQIIVDTYFDLITLRLLPEHEELGQLDSLADSTKPTYLQLPSDVVRLKYDYFFYDSSDTDQELSYTKVVWCEPETFLMRSHRINPDNSTTTAMLDLNAGSTIYVHNDQHPTYFTTFDDRHLVCNSWDQAVDSVLQNSKTQAFFLKRPSFAKTDSTVPDMDPDYIPYLKSEARARAFAWKDKTINEKAEQITRRNKIHVQNQLMRIGSESRKRDYGRT